ncbi:BMP family lipoprotein [Carnobacterium inhibens]|uniref:BMP family ABC transporter substrate-binding protein n=1 Tax=Carnobacterium inhibens TaxID=147709 RepID=A0ABR7TB98_9LACT|nr:BMP family protein [Carnobacterium inhibens]MBC9825230.1 BMP family ABC transporter substrate-binding protein [Carnobacterium inhibens]
MKSRNFKSLLTLGLLSSLTLAACGADEGSDNASSSGSGEDYSIVMVTDVGGVDDKSFNQSAWEGMEAWGEEHKLEKGPDGYNYIQSDEDSQFVTNLNTAVNNNFDLIFGIGFKLKPAMIDVAEQNPDQNFVIIDETIEADNVSSVLFKDHEAAFLAGVAAAETTETDHVGFIGGQQSAVIDRFEAGFVAGVQDVNPDIKIDVEYAGSFGDAALGKQLAAAMYSSGADIIYHASGDTGNGVFSEAIDRMNSNPDQKLWVIGVDRDQTAEGEYDGGNLTLTSTLKGVGQAVQDIANASMEGNFPGGEISNFGLAEDSVGITEGALSEDVIKTVEDYKQQIIDGTITVPEAP